MIWKSKQWSEINVIMYESKKEMNLVTKSGNMLREHKMFTKNLILRNKQVTGVSGGWGGDGFATTNKLLDKVIGFKIYYHTQHNIYYL